MAEGGGDSVATVHGGSRQGQVTFSKRGMPETHEVQNTDNGDNPPSLDVVEIIVYFPDNTGVHVKVRDGQNIEAGELFEVVKDVMKFPNEVRDIFSLWLVSEFLELQLKPKHVPFKLVCYWEELLEKYTTAPEELVQRDEPVIMFRRNVFFPLASEKSLMDAELLRLLYHEAKRNILVGHYPLDQGNCDSQAAIQAVITRKELEKEGSGAEAGFGSAAFFKSCLTEYLPPHFCKRNWIYKKHENPEHRLAKAYGVASDSYMSQSLEYLYRIYLDLCHRQPYYGSAFFRGQAEHPVKGIASKVLSTKDDPVYVAINVDGVFIIDMDDFALLIGFYYEKLSWQFVESSRNENNPNCLPCLFLQFPAEDKPNETKLLQIFSREAVLMDNLIEACVGLKRISGTKKNQEDCQVIYGKGTLAETFSRLALMTFSADGRRIGSTVRSPKQTAGSAASAPV